MKIIISRGTVALLMIFGAHNFCERLRAAEKIDFGYLDFSYGFSGRWRPTGEKPENKIWYNDGIWWGSLYSDQSQANHIHRLNLQSQQWTDTGVALDERNDSLADTLWDEVNQKLYIVSHIFENRGEPSSDPNEWGRLYRYSYIKDGQTYRRDPGFPVTVNGGRSETLTMAKDQIGRLWVTYVEDSRIMVNHSLNSDREWGIPYQIPFQSGVVSDDDISALVRMGNLGVGLIWSNQITTNFHFSLHLNESPPSKWEPEEIIAKLVKSDDHLSIKFIDSGGSNKIFCAVKTGQHSPEASQIKMIVRFPNRNWVQFEYGTVADDHNRPALILDEENRLVHIFSNSPADGGGIYHKFSSIDTISFIDGLGQPFISDLQFPKISDATSTRDNLNSTTDLVLLASDRENKFYLHGFLPIQRGAVQVSSFSPDSVMPGDELAIQGSGFGPQPRVFINGLLADNMTIESPNRITVNIPQGARTGKVSVLSEGTTGLGSALLSVFHLPFISQFSPTSGSPRSKIIISGRNFTGTQSVKIGGQETVFTVETDNEIQAEIPLCITSGQVQITNPAGMTTSAASLELTGYAQTVALSPIADAMVYEGAPNTNYCCDDFLRLRDELEGVRRSYLQFEVSGIPQLVKRAILRLYVTDGSRDGGSLYRVSDLYRDRANRFTEESINWSNAPLIDGEAIDSAGRVSEGDWVEFDLTAALAGNGIYSFALSSESSDSVLFSSKEADENRPELLIELYNDERLGYLCETRLAQTGNGQGLVSDVVLTNPSYDSAAEAVISFLDSEGRPTDLISIDSSGTGPSAEGEDLSPVPVSVPPLGSLVRSTDGTGPVVVGSALVSSSSTLGGFVRYQIPSLGITGVGVSEPLTACITPVRREPSGMNSGVAFQNASNRLISVTLILRNQAGQALEGGKTSVEDIPPGGHVARFINELFPEAETEDFTGTLALYLNGDGEIAVTALELGDSPGEFSALPVIPLIEPGKEKHSSRLFFAQFGNGEGFWTDVVLTNPSSQKISAVVEAFGDQGDPAVLADPGESQLRSAKPFANGNGPYEIEPYGLVTLRTDGTGPLTSGSIIVSADGDVGGIIRFNSPVSGTTSVSNSPPLKAFIVPVSQKVGDIKAGVALQNPGVSALTLSLQLNDSKGLSIPNGFATIVLPPRGHFARFMNELFPNSGTSSFDGTLTVTVDGAGDVTATALELGPGPGEFLTLPVTPIDSP